MLNFTGELNYFHITLTITYCSGIFRDIRQPFKKDFNQAVPFKMKKNLSRNFNYSANFTSIIYIF